MSDLIPCLRKTFRSIVLRIEHFPALNAPMLALLYVHGGVYADLDTEVVGNLEKFLRSADQSHAEVIVGMENILHARLLEKRDDGIVSNAIIFAQKKAPFLLQLLQSIFRKSSYCTYDDPVECTGPRVLDSEARIYNQSRMLILPYAYFSPTVAQWNAAALVSSCSFAPPSRKRACRILRNVLDSPKLLFSWRTLVIHHWQCSWCRTDKSLRSTTPLGNIHAQFSTHNAFGA